MSETFVTIFWTTLFFYTLKMESVRSFKTINDIPEYTASSHKTADPIFIATAM
jgi:hypothetical protein